MRRVLSHVVAGVCVIKGKLLAARFTAAIPRLIQHPAGRYGREALVNVALTDLFPLPSFHGEARGCLGKVQDPLLDAKEGSSKTQNNFTAVPAHYTHIELDELAV